MEKEVRDEVKRNNSQLLFIKKGKRQMKEKKD